MRESEQPSLLESRSSGNEFELLYRSASAANTLAVSEAWQFAECVAGDGPHLKLTRRIPMLMRRPGVEMKFVIGDNPTGPRGADPALVKLIGRARCWINDLIDGRAASMAAIGKRKRVGKRYVSGVIRFAFLAPKIVEEVVGGGTAQISPLNRC